MPIVVQKDKMNVTPFKNEEVSKPTNFNPSPLQGNNVKVGKIEIDTETGNVENNKGMEVPESVAREVYDRAMANAAMSDPANTRRTFPDKVTIEQPTDIIVNEGAISYQELKDALSDEDFANVENHMKRDFPEGTNLEEAWSKMDASDQTQILECK